MNQSNQPPPATKQWWVLIGTGLAAFMMAVDYTIVNTALPNIQKSLLMDVSQLQWIIAGFGLSFCTFLVAFGRLGDLIGRRKILYLGIIGFGLTSLGAGMAHTALLLVSMRILQGLFAAAMYPCGMAITADAFSQKMQVRALSIYGSLLGTGLAFGPVIGSLILSTLNWRWIFFINIPIIVVSLTICFFTVRESRLPEKIKIDWIGAILLIASLGALIFTISQAPVYGWTSRLILCTFMLAIIGFIMLFLSQKYGKNPLIPIKLFLNHGFLLGFIIALVTISFCWTVVFFMPLYLHVVLMFTPGITGLVLFSMTLMTAFTPALAGYWFANKNKQLTLHTIFVLGLASFGMFCLFSTDGPLLLVIIAFICFGWVWGMGNGIAIPLTLSKLDSTQDAGLVTGALVTLTNTIALLILTISTVIFRTIDYSYLRSVLSAGQIELDTNQHQSLKNLLTNPDAFIHQVSKFTHIDPARILAIFHDSFMSGLHGVFIVLLIITLLLWIIAIKLIRELD